MMENVTLNKDNNRYSLISTIGKCLVTFDTLEEIYYYLLKNRKGKVCIIDNILDINDGCLFSGKIEDAINWLKF